LVLRLEEGPEGTRALEALSPGSPGRTLDSLTASYTLYLEGDSLRARSGTTPAKSRLFGKIDGARSLFPVLGLELVSPRIEDGLPVLDAGKNILAGRLEGNPVGWGKDLVSPGLLLDGRGIESGQAGMGFLHTREGGLERAWRFGGRDGTTTGWNRL
jgi:hypothetical protein